MLVKLLVLASLLSSCIQSLGIKGDLNVGGDFSRYQERLMKEFLADGFVVAKDKHTGKPHDQGDSLLFTGISLGVVDCDSAPTFLTALEKMQDDWDGYLVRINPLPSEFIENDDTITRDGATGALFGLVKVASHCPALAPRANAIKKRWYDAVGDAWHLHPDGKNGLMSPSFKVVWDVANDVEMSYLDYAVYMSSTLITSKVIAENKHSCYPVHLETLQHLILESKGFPILKADKESFCRITSPMGLRLTDWFCERNTDTLKSWLDDPASSKQTYVHQRCVWESENSADKLSPRVDFLILFGNLQRGSTW